MIVTDTITSPFSVGDRVQVSEVGAYPSASGYYGHVRLETTETFRITREYKEVFTIKREKDRYYAGNSFNVPKDKLVAAPPPVDLSAVPSGSIPVDDPRLDYLWVHAAEIAKEMHLCSDYDKFADKLGIPGREREINVKVNVNGVDVSAKITARSRPEAERLLKAKLGVK